MLHVVKQLQNRFPNQATRIAPTLLVLSTLGVLVGLGLMIQ